MRTSSTNAPGYAPDGALAGVVDVDWYIEQAKANNAFSHLEGGTWT